jgi:hypothetical protein
MALFFVEEQNGLSTKAIKILAILHQINIMGANGRLYVVCVKSSVNGTRKQTEQKIQTN